MASNTTYYAYKDVKEMIVGELQKRQGWKIYDWSPAESDPYTDYYCPSYWGGVAEKNGYVLVVDNSRQEDAKEIREYVHRESAGTAAGNISAKLEKLREMTVERGASEAEEATAKAAIEKLLQKQQEASEKAKETVVTGICPGHMANPPRCNWHIEKDGVIIAKGTGLLKYAGVRFYFTNDRWKEDMMEFKRHREDYLEYEKERMRHTGKYYGESEEKIAQEAKWNMERLESAEKLYDAFNQLIGKFDTTAGGLMGNAEYEYKKVKVTEYRTERKAVECPGEIKEGQEIILKSNFNYGRNKGYVYRLHESAISKKNPEEKFYRAVRLNGKLDKELTGTSNHSNRMFNMSLAEAIMKWINSGDIAFCKIVEEKVPYEVEKIVKVPIKNQAETDQEDPEGLKNMGKNSTEENFSDVNESAETPVENAPVDETAPESEPEQQAKEKTEDKNGKKEKHMRKKEREVYGNLVMGETYTYDVREDFDTRDGSKIWIVRVQETLKREEYAAENKEMVKRGGYYSKFKHGFLFREDPTELLSAKKTSEEGAA